MLLMTLMVFILKNMQAQPPTSFEVPETEEVVFRQVNNVSADGNTSNEGTVNIQNLCIIHHIMYYTKA